MPGQQGMQGDRENRRPHPEWTMQGRVVRGPPRTGFQAGMGVGRRQSGGPEQDQGEPGRAPEDAVLESSLEGSVGIHRHMY